MKFLPPNKVPSKILALLSTLLVLLVTILSVKLQSDFRKLRKEFADISNAQNMLKENLSTELYKDHLSIISKLRLENEVSQLQSQIEKEGNEEGQQVYDLYEDFKSKMSRNLELELDVSGPVEEMKGWGDLLLNQSYEELISSIQNQNSILDSVYDEYLASLPPPAPSPASGGYSYTTVNTEKGTFGVYLIKIPLRDVTVKTVAAIDRDCSNNCPTKSLEEYVKENNGFAGINGSYACPPDYDECQGKINSFDFALYDSNDRRWINKDALTWFKTGMITFRGRDVKFYKKTSDYDGDSVTAAVSNFPSLLKDRNIVVNDGDVTAYQKVKGLRGAIGVGGENLYLAHIPSASVEEAAYVMRALGVIHALNLDGGGTAAMYINGQYVVGPGRSLANAIILVK